MSDDRFRLQDDGGGDERGRVTAQRQDDGAHRPPGAPPPGAPPDARAPERRGRVPEGQGCHRPDGHLPAHRREGVPVFSNLTHVHSSFCCDADAIRELTRHSFNWGLTGKSKSERVLKLLERGPFLEEEREQASPASWRSSRGPIQVPRLLRNLSVLDLFLRAVDRNCVRVFHGDSICIVLCWCRGLVPKRDEAGRAIGTVGAHLPSPWGALGAAAVGRRRTGAGHG